MAYKEVNKEEKFVFGKTNYILMFLGIIIIIVGYLLMVGGASEDPAVFNEEELYSTVRITVAPILIVLGLLIQIPAIMYKPKAQVD